MKKIINFYLSLGFIGYIKTAPGSFGSLLSIFILFPFFYYEIFDLLIYILIFILFFIISLKFIDIFSRENNNHDSKIIIIDEFLGIYLIYLFYDLIFIYNHIFTCLLVFLFFRFFDIIKIFPANIIDKRMLNSFGVILDDIVASLYTILSIYFLNVLL